MRSQRGVTNGEVVEQGVDTYQDPYLTGLEPKEE